jgi:hypothetical protein
VDASAFQNPHRGVGQGHHALRVQVIGEDGGDEFRDSVAVEEMVAHEVAA